MSTTPTDPAPTPPEGPLPSDPNQNQDSNPTPTPAPTTSTTTTTSTPLDWSKKHQTTLFAAALHRFAHRQQERFSIIRTRHTLVDYQPPRYPPYQNTLIILDSSFNPPTIAHLHVVLSALKAPRIEQYKRPIRLLLLLATRNADKTNGEAKLEERLGMMYAFAGDIKESYSSNGERMESGTGQGQGSMGKVEIDIGVTKEPYFHAKAEAILAGEDYHFIKPYMRAPGSGEYEDWQSRPEQVYLVGYDSLVRIFDSRYYYSNLGGLGADEREMVWRLEKFFEDCRLRVTFRGEEEEDGELDKKKKKGEETKKKKKKEEMERFQSSFLERTRPGECVGADERFWNEWKERIEFVEGMYEKVSSTLVREAAARKDWEVVERLCTKRVAEWVVELGLYEGFRGEGRKRNAGEALHG